MQEGSSCWPPPFLHQEQSRGQAQPPPQGWPSHRRAGRTWRLMRAESSISSRKTRSACHSTRMRLPGDRPPSSVLQKPGERGSVLWVTGFHPGRMGSHGVQPLDVETPDDVEPALLQHSHRYRGPGVRGGAQREAERVLTHTHTSVQVC